jgi:hypothetical protein
MTRLGWANLSDTINPGEEDIAEERDDLQHAYEQIDDPDTIEKDQQEMMDKKRSRSHQTPPISPGKSPKNQIP